MSTADDIAVVRAVESGDRALVKAFEQRVRESGAIAFRGGVARRDCPLRKGSAAHTYWLRGFDAAKRAAAAEAPGRPLHSRDDQTDE